MRNPPHLSAIILVAVLAGCTNASTTGPAGEAFVSENALSAQASAEAPAQVPNLGAPDSAALPGEDFFERAYQESLRVIEAYLERSDLITSQAGRDSGSMRPLVSERWFPTESAGFSRYQATGEWTSGETRFENSFLQLARITPEKTLDVSVFGCVDTVSVFVLGAEVEAPPEQVSLGHPDYADPELTEDDWDVIRGFYDQEGVRFGDRRAIVFWLVGPNVDNLVIDSSLEWWGVHEC